MYALGKARGPLNFRVFNLKTSKVIWKIQEKWLFLISFKLNVML